MADVDSMKDGKHSSASPSRATSGVLATPNSAARRSMLDPYHELASSLFDMADTQEMESTFLTAAKEGDFAKIEALLKRRNETIFSLDVRDKETGNTALIWAAKRGHSKIVELLLRYGADVTLRNYDGQTAIEEASSQIQQLLLSSAGIGGLHRNLRQAAWQGDSALVQKILAEAKVDINCRNDEGLTPLLLVTRDVHLFERLGSKMSSDCKYNPLEVIQELLKHRADPNATDEKGKTALHYVSASKASLASDIAMKLLEDGCDTDARDSRAFAPIHCASQSGNVQVLLALLDGGSDANVKGYAGATPLHISAINGHDQVAHALLQRGADVTLVDDSGLTAVDVAKTKKVKATLRHAWTEATQMREPVNLAPVREGSARSVKAKGKRMKMGGEVMFDEPLSRSDSWLTLPGVCQRPLTPAVDVTQSCSSLPPIGTNQVHEAWRIQSGGVSGLNTRPLTRSVSDASTRTRKELLDIPPLFRSLVSNTFNAEGARKMRPGLPQRDASDRSRHPLLEESAALDDSKLSLARCGNYASPRSPKTRRLTPLKAPSPRKNVAGAGTPAATSGVKFSPGTKIHDGSSYSRHGSASSQHRGLHKCPSDPGRFPQGPQQIPVTVLDLDLEGNLQECKVRRFAHGSMGQALPTRRGHFRHNSDPNSNSPEPVTHEDYYLRGRCPSKASVVTVNEELGESDTPTGCSPPRLTPLHQRTSSASAERSLYARPLVGEGTLYTYPAPKHLLPSTFVTQPDDMSEADLRLTECSHDFSVISGHSSPMGDGAEGEEVEEEEADDGISLPMTSQQEAIASLSILKDGNFNIEDSRVRTSNDSGLPEDKNSQSSKSSSVASSVSNSSSGSPRQHEAQRAAEKSLQPQSGIKDDGKPEEKVTEKGTSQVEAAITAANASSGNKQMQEETAKTRSSSTPRERNLSVTSDEQSKRGASTERARPKSRGLQRPREPPPKPPSPVTVKEPQSSLQEAKSVKDSMKTDRTSITVKSPRKSQNRPIMGTNGSLTRRNSTPRVSTKYTPLRPSMPPRIGPAACTTDVNKSNNQPSNAQEDSSGTPDNPPDASKISYDALQRTRSKSTDRHASSESAQSKSSSVSRSSNAVAPMSSSPMKVQSIQRPSSMKSTAKQEVAVEAKTEPQGNTSSSKAAASSSRPNAPVRPPKPSVAPKPIEASSKLEGSKTSTKGFSPPVTASFSSDAAAGNKSSMTTSGVSAQVKSKVSMKPRLPAERHANPASVKPSEHKGPVIQDPFESLRKEREANCVEEKDKAQAARVKSAVTKKPMKKAPTHENQRQTSAGRKGKAKGRSNEPVDAKANLVRPKSTKKSKAGANKRKHKPDSKKNSMALSQRADEDNVTFVSGIGWHIETECHDKSDVKAAVIRLDDSSDSEAEIPRVLPNYVESKESPVIVKKELKSQDTPRCSLGDASSVLPGQALLSDSGGEQLEDEAAEDMYEDIVFNEVTDDVKDILPVDDKEYEDLMLVAEMKARAESPVIRNEVIPQTVKAIEDFSKTIKQEDLTKMLESPDESKIDSKPLSAASNANIMVEPSKPKQIFVKEAVPGESLSLKVALPKPEEPPKKDVTSLPKEPLEADGLNQGLMGQKSEPEVLTPVEKASFEVKNDANDATIKKRQVTNQASSTVKKSGSSSSCSMSNKHPRAPRTKEREEQEINCMIDEILKSTPDPTLSLSWRTSRKVKDTLAEKGFKAMTQEDFSKELCSNQSCTFQQVPVKSGGELGGAPDGCSQVNAEEAEALDSDLGSFGEDEMATIEKLAHALKDLPLKVTDDSDEEPEGARKESSVCGKPPVAPKSSKVLAADAKSPRFIRKHDSYKATQHAKLPRDGEDMGDVMSEFGSNVSLPTLKDESLVDTDRAEVVTSRLGRRNSTSRAPSAMTNETSQSASDEVETIQWKRGNMLGKGAYGTVWCGLTNTGGLIAVKQIELNTDNMNRAELEYEKIQEEVELLKNLNHKNIVGYLGTSLEEHIVSIFMEFVPGGSIANLLARFGALEEEVFCHYTCQILEGVQYLHANNVIHRDIKGGNIMLMPNSEIKLIDFGCAKRLCLNMSVGAGSRTRSSSHNRLLKSMRGTPYWMAPEVVKEEGHGTRSDIWSVGCTVFEMATRKPPWSEMPPLTAIFAIGSDTKPVPELPEKFTSEARDFVNLCLTRDQHKRPSATQMLSHSFILKRRKSKLSGCS